MKNQNRYSSASGKLNNHTRQWSAEEEQSEDEDIYHYLCESVESSTKFPEIPKLNVESKECIWELNVSNDNSKQNFRNRFPPLTDPGINEATFKPARGTQYDNDKQGYDAYLDFCKKFHTVPITRIRRALQSEELNLQDYGVSEQSLRSVCLALATNQSVLRLNLSESWLNATSCRQLAAMLSVNTTLVEINLSGCRIGPEGISALSHAIENTMTLHVLMLASCNLGDSGGVELAKAIEDNLSIEVLDISNNNLGEPTALAFCETFKKSYVLIKVEMGRNSFYENAVVPLLRGMRANTSITYLGLCWNGMSGRKIGIEIAQMLIRNKTIAELDLSHNRLDGASVLPFLIAIRKCSLNTLKIGDNPLAADVVEKLLKTTAMSKITFIDMTHLWIDRDSKPLLERDSLCVNLPFLEKAQMKAEVIIEGIYRNKDIPEIDMKPLLLDRAKYLAEKPPKKKPKKPKQPLLLGYYMHYLLNLENPFMDRTEFINAIHAAKYKKLDIDLLNAWLDEYNVVMGRGRAPKINVKLLAEEYLARHPTELPPPPKEKKPKEKKVKKAKKKK